MPLNVHESAPKGCDQWTGARYCEADASHVDEVDDLRYCTAHAGPLSWPVRDVNLYSLALVVSGYLDLVYQLPVSLRSRLYPTARAAA